MADNISLPTAEAPKAIACNVCHWRMGWLQRPGEYWCAVTGSGVGDGREAPGWCPTDRAQKVKVIGG